MIYVIKIEYKNIDLLKIGYTKDENKDIRYSQYKMHNPLYQVIYEIPGATEEQEKALHLKFSKYLHIGREWFECNEEILNYFDTHSDINSLIEDLGSIEKPGSLEFKKEVKRVINLLLNYKVSQGDITLEDGAKQLDNLVNRILSDRKIKTLPVFWNYIEEVFGISITDLDSKIKPKVINNFLIQFDSFTQFTDKMKLLCESVDQFTKDEFESILNSINIVFKNYFLTIGSDRIRNLQYKNSMIKTEYERVKNNQGKFGNLQEVIYSVFLVEERYTKVFIKDRLGEIYESLGIKASPKATDLENYFEIKKIQITNKDTGKKDHGYKILKKKEL